MTLHQHKEKHPKNILKTLKEKELGLVFHFLIPEGTQFMKNYTLKIKFYLLLCYNAHVNAISKSFQIIS